MENSKNKLIAYTDGSAWPSNPGFYGAGIHGYLFNDNCIKKNNDRPTSHYITDIGYVPKESKKHIKCEEVKPLKYLNMTCSYKGEGTNNMGELLAIIELLKIVNSDEFNVNEIIIHSDSTYAIGLLNRCIKEDTGDFGIDKPNIELIQSLIEWVAVIKKAGTTIKIVKVKAHDGDYGNEIADRLAFLGRDKSFKGKFGVVYKLLPGNKYWNRVSEKNPLINVKQIFFAKDMRKLPEYIIMNYPTDVELGKKSNESLYGVVRLNEPNSMLETLIDIYNKSLKSLSVLSTVILKTAWSSKLINYYETFGSDILIFNSKQRNITILEDEEVVTVIKPAGLATQAYIKTIELGNILNTYVNDEGGVIRSFIDITEQFFTIDSKNKVICTLKNGNNIKEVIFTKDDAEYKIPLILGIDILPRNNIKKMEDSNPKITLVVDNINKKILEYYIIIENNTGKAIYCNFYANKIFI